jgi:nicotinate-nucleotide pyrophosphorylase (carboxylating)
VVRAVRAALAEDVGTGDVTSRAILAPDHHAHARLIVKRGGVIAGLEVARAVFAEVDRRIGFHPCVEEGRPVEAGTVVAEVTGPAASVLTAERTALNVLQRMSGIATLTRQFVDRVAGTGTVILDTRKTAPGLRAADKMAVRAGGGRNHRAGLFDMVLIKDNHIDACGTITEAVARVRRHADPALAIEVECRTLAHVLEALPLGVDRLLLDNMTPAAVRECVHAVGGRVPLEVSGNVTLATVRDYAQTGVACISVGALTHSVQALDISLVVTFGLEGNEHTGHH